MLFRYTVCMSWALRRRFIILGIIAAAVALALGFFYFTIIHVPPSCTDNKQNGTEEGVDCGGTCTYLCTASEAEPSVRFVRPVSPMSGRTDVIAYIDNPNANAAAKRLPYTIELYDSQNVVVAKKDGTVDLPPNSTVPIFVPDFYTGDHAVARAFLTFDEPSHYWYRYQETRTLPKVANVVLTTSNTPRITATAVNTGATSVGGTYFVATVFDTEGNAIAASQTIATGIPAQGSVELTFTWPSAFSGTVSRIEVVPLVRLP